MQRQKGSKGKSTQVKGRSSSRVHSTRTPVTTTSSSISSLSSSIPSTSSNTNANNRRVNVTPGRRTISTVVSSSSSSQSIGATKRTTYSKTSLSPMTPSISPTLASFSKKATKGGKAAAAAAAVAPDARQIAEGLTRDIRARVAEYKRRKPTLDERLKNTTGLYSDKSIEQINDDDVGKLIQFDINEQDESMRYYLKKENEAGDGFWMIRPQSLGVMDFIDKNVNKVTLPRQPKGDQLYATNVPNIGIVHGHRGTGKSVTMAQAFSYAKSQGWIALAFTGYDTIHDMQGVIKASIQPGRGGSYDQLLKSRLFLEKLALAYPDLLKQIPLQQTHYEEYGDWIESEDARFNAPKNLVQTGEFYPWPNPEIVPRPTEPVGKTLFDLASVGAWRTDLAAWAATDTLRELKRQTQFPVFIGIDDFNAMDQLSDYVNPAKLRYRLEANRLSMVQALHECVDEPPHRGITLVSTSSRFTQYRVPNLLERAGETIPSLAYDNLQLQGMLEHYHQSKFILTQMDVEFLRRAEVLTGGNPLDLRKFSSVQ